MRGGIGRSIALFVTVLTLAACAVACGSEGEAETGRSDGGVAAGDVVAATWTDGALYLATVTSVDGDTIAVTYEDDGSSATLPSSDVREIPDVAFAAGDRVLAVWSNGRFYPGEVQEVGDGSCVIAWDDGSSPSSVESGRIIAE